MANNIERFEDEAAFTALLGRLGIINNQATHITNDEFLTMKDIVEFFQFSTFKDIEKYFNEVNKGLFLLNCTSFSFHLRSSSI